MEETAGVLSSVDDFTHLPLVTIIGAVFPTGVSGTRPSNAPGWTLDFPLAAWRIGDGRMRTDRLVVMRPLADNELVSYLEIIEANTVVSIRARVKESTDGSPPHALLEEYLGVDVTDADMQSQLAELLQPKTIRDERFGILEFCDNAEWFTGTTDWYGTRVAIRAIGTDHTEVEKSLDIAQRVWSQSGLERQVRLRAARVLLGMKNDQWRENNESPLSEEQFMHRLKLKAITINGDGSYVFVFDDDKLFWGQRIHVTGTLANGPSTATL
jgi:hypothetical protein